MFDHQYEGKRIWLSGHTGFKGSWLAAWLLELGAEVYGYSLAPQSNPALFDQLELAPRLRHHCLADIRDREAVHNSLAQTQPDFVFHLAAQPLVRRSYSQPIETYETNVNGTLHVLESLKSLSHPCTALFITTDKCYENLEHGLPYAEGDRLGGRDPYSSSKAMAEIAIAAYRQSYFSSPHSCVRVASARAGNVIGGGDWAEDRIVPDCIRSLQKGSSILVRNPAATRPWQHVLEPLSGYLWYAAALSRDPSLPPSLNFGPSLESNRSVQELVTKILTHWPGEWIDGSDSTAVHEAKLLGLSIEKAASLGWRPVWSFENTIHQTIAWYRKAIKDPDSTPHFSLAQIHEYSSAANSAGLEWASH